VNGSSVGENDTIVAVDHEPARLVENILNVLPDTNSVFVVVGTSRLEQLWLDAMKLAFRPFEDRVTFSWANELSFEEMVARCAALPSHSAILFAILSVDAKGVPQVEDHALARLAASANAPVFGLRSTQLGHGIVGGPLVSVDDLSRDTTRVALRLLDGEAPRNVASRALRLAPPVFDARELRRWKIDEVRLPTGSTVRFRDGTVWQRHKRPIVAGAAIVGVQLILVAALVVSLGRRRRIAAARSTRRLMQAHERECVAVARELQDDLCQRMIALTIQLQALSRRQANTGGENIGRDVEELSGRLGDLANKVFSVSDQLHSSKVELLGLAAAARIVCRDLSARHDVVVDFHDENVPASLSNYIAQTLFAVMQEALRNAIKHSGARRVAVSICGGWGEVQLEVADEGVGFDPEAGMQVGGLGLLAMKARVTVVQGECAIESRPGAGTRVRVRVPMTPPEPRVAESR
jgi:signal transduction histidine kinase